MPITNRLRRLLHRKAWEFASPSIAATTTGGFVAALKNTIVPGSDCIFQVTGASGIYQYNAAQDAWLQLPNSGIAGIFAAGACGEAHPIGMLGGSPTSTATAGTTTTLTTNRTIVRSIAGCLIRVVAGTGVGYEGTIASNTLGGNAVLTVTPASGVAFDATSVFEVYSGSLWFFNAGTTAVGFSVYDRATNTWTAKSVTGLPTAWGTDGQLVSTPSVSATVASGTATAGGATSLTTSRNDPLNCWANYQVRITGGTGRGQVRAIASNTAGPNSVLTVGAAWTVNPDATSTFAIEGNNDNLYLIGNNAVTMYRYSISANTWATLAPGAARAVAAGPGATLNWIDSAQGWNDTTLAQQHIVGGGIMRQNGRYLYSFRAGGGTGLDVYDIAANTWVSSVSYGNQNEMFTSGSTSLDFDGRIYIQKESTGRIYRFDVAANVLEPWANNVYVQSQTVTGGKMFMQSFTDTGTTLRWLYTMVHSRAELLRMLVVDG